MKECEWCGDDFRGQAEELNGHFFCGTKCLEEWREEMCTATHPDIGENEE